MGGKAWCHSDSIPSLRFHRRCERGSVGDYRESMDIWTGGRRDRHSSARQGLHYNEPSHASPLRAMGKSSPTGYTQNSIAFSLLQVETSSSTPVHPQTWPPHTPRQRLWDTAFCHHLIFSTGTSLLIHSRRLALETVWRLGLNPATSRSPSTICRSGGIGQAHQSHPQALQ